MATSHANPRVAKSAAPSRRRKSPVDGAPERHASIAEAAYFKSKQRGFTPGSELADWLAAEQEIDQRLRAGSRAL